MASLFVDTSGWAAYFVASEAFHLAAKQVVMQGLASRRRFITTNYVLAELTAVLTSPIRVTGSRRIQITDTIRGALWGRVVHIDPVLNDEAWDLLRRRPDKEWSLVDCASFVVMTRRGIAEA